MQLDAHVKLLRETDNRIETDDQAVKVITQATDQMIHYVGSEWVDTYLAEIIPKAIPDAVELNKSTLQVLSTFQAMYMMARSIGLEPDGKGFAQAMDALISNSAHKKA